MPISAGPPAPNPQYAIRYTLYAIRCTIMQNKPNFQKSQMNANLYNTTDYENKWQRRVRKNKPNSNPIKPNFQKAKMNANAFSQKDYENETTLTLQKNKANSNPISEKPKMNANVYVIEDYENETALRPKKTNPIKPNSCGFLLEFIPHRVYPALRCGDAGQERQCWRITHEI
ncbi:MAG: hypothetical protein ABIL62_00500 [Planctomycetota bacterium]